jgi:hypothetical protein
MSPALPRPPRTDNPPSGGHSPAFAGRGPLPFIIHTSSFIILSLLLIPSTLLAQTCPAWWTTQGILATGSAANDFAAANQGQAKNIALGAVNELYTDLSGFPAATAHLDSLAAFLYTTGTATGANDFAAINLGQLKNLIQPIYDTLLTAGYRDPTASGGPLESGTYPWDPSASPPGSANDYAIANLGQLKYLFSFDPTLDTNANGLPDWWENLYGIPLTGTAAVSSTTDVRWSGGQVNYLQAFQQGFNPVDFYDGQTPTLTIVGGDGQTGSPGALVPAPLVVSVTDTNQNPIVGAPVTFTVATGSGSLQISSTSSQTNSATLFTDFNGQALIYFQLPSSPSITTQVTVTTGTTASVTQVFSESSDDGSGSFSNPFAPSNVIGYLNPDGTQSLTWQNNEEESPIYIYQQSGSIWTVTGTLPAGSTSYVTSVSGAGNTEIGNNFTPGSSTGATSGSSDPGSAAFTPIPVQNYAAMDISAGVMSSSTNQVTNVALDDNNNAAFGFYTVPYVDEPPPSGNFISYSWQSGTSTQVCNFPLHTGSGDEEIAYSVVDIASNGTAYGNRGGPAIDPPGGPGFGAIMIASGTNPSTMGPPIPPYATGTNSDLEVQWSALVGVSPTGSGFCYNAEGYYIQSLIKENNVEGTVASGPTGYAIFDYELPPLGFSPSYVHSDYFIDLYASSDDGEALGYTYNPGFAGAFWDGHQFFLLAGDAFLQLNSAGQVAGDLGGDGSPSLFTSPNFSSVCPLVISGSTQSISSLIPKCFRNEITMDLAVDISGTNSQGGIKILLEGSSQSDPQGDLDTGYYLLTLTSGSNPSTFQRICMPSDYYGGGPSMINSSGVMAGMGYILDNGAPLPSVVGNGDAILLLPVEFTGTNGNPLTGQGTSGINLVDEPNLTQYPDFAFSMAFRVALQNYNPGQNFQCTFPVTSLDESGNQLDQLQATLAYDGTVGKIISKPLLLQLSPQSIVLPQTE